jgi:hypothetical protein
MATLACATPNGLHENGCVVIPADNNLAPLRAVHGEEHDEHT